MSLNKIEQKIRGFLKEVAPRPYRASALADIFNYKGAKQFQRMVKALNFLERTGEITLDARGRYAYKQEEQAKHVSGIFRANAKGFGFVRYADDEPDLFIPPNKTNEAMDGDEVEVTIIKAVNPDTGKGSEAVIDRVLKRAHHQLVGEFIAYSEEEKERTGFLGVVSPTTPMAQPIELFILPDGLSPVDGSIVLVTIRSYPTAQNPRQMTGLVTKEIGHKNEPGTDILSVLYKFGIPTEFSEQTLASLKSIPEHVLQTEIGDRLDLRGELIFTIDGADAKDLDDAISIRQLDEDRYELGVHIADVAHYVPDNSPIDEDAFMRATSVYLTDRVVPMLPPQLSNGICSLNPHVDRLTRSCIMVISRQGDVLSHQICDSVIRSKYRMTYDAVNLILDGDAALRHDYDAIVQPLELMADLHRILAKKRKRRGAIDFDTQEAHVIVDESGQPIDIEVRQRGVGERMIESFMLVANETVAKHFADRKMPFIYRVHDEPDEDRIDQFAQFASSFGIVLRGNTAKITPKQLQGALDAAKNEPFEPVLSMILLRSMQQAIYSEEPRGHFGLAAHDYTHFTSPIRRYPDLLVHRLIKRYQSERLDRSQRQILEEQIPGIAEHSSKMERRAIDAEREVEALKKAEYMLQHVGETFEGSITSITSFGFFVQLPNTIEGLVRLDTLQDDFYHFVPERLLLVGERTGQLLKIGQTVQIEVTQVNVPERQIDFTLVHTESEQADATMLTQIKGKSAQKKNRSSRRQKSSNTKKTSRNRRTKDDRTNSTRQRQREKRRKGRKR